MQPYSERIGNLLTVNPMAATPASSATHERQLRENEKKWGAELMAAGWTCLPSTILQRQQALGLDSVDLNIILLIASHWWRADSLPFPSKKLMAQTIGIDESNVRKRIAKLEAGKLIKRVERRVPGQRSKSNIYDLSGLIEAATGYAKEEIVLRELQRKSRIDRPTRKGKPRLTVVPAT